MAKDPPVTTANVTKETVDLGEVSDGEIMNEEEDKDVVTMNRMAHIAATVARDQKLAEQKAVASALQSKVKANPEEESKQSSGAGSKARPDMTNIDNLPEDMICCICMSARKSVMI